MLKHGFHLRFGRYGGHRALCLDQIADAIGIISFVGQNDGARIEAIEQAIRRWPIMCLPSGQAEPNREALRIDNSMDFGREAASGSTETMISIPLFAVAACWCARMEMLSIMLNQYFETGESFTSADTPIVLPHSPTIEASVMSDERHQPNSNAKHESGYNRRRHHCSLPRQSHRLSYHTDLLPPVFMSSRPHRITINCGRKEGKRCNDPESFVVKLKYLDNG